MKTGYLRNLRLCLKYRWATLAVMGGLIVATLVLLPFLGREFMPELEEGNLWIRGTFPVNISLDAVSGDVTGSNSRAVFGKAQEELPQQAVRKRDVALDIITKFPEVDLAVAQLGRPDDGTDPTGFYNAEFFVPLKREKDWPAVKPQ